MNLTQTYPPLDRYLETLELEMPDLSIRDFTESFNWLGNRKLFCVFNFYDKSNALVLLENESNEWVHLNEVTDARFFFEIDQLSRSVNFSSKEEVREFVQTIYQLYSDPRGEVLDDVFLQRNEQVLFTYLNTRIEGKMDPKKDYMDSEEGHLLKSYCTKIECSRIEDAWRINFNLMTKDGGVYNWLVLIGEKTGTIEITQKEKDQTFLFPNIY